MPKSSDKNITFVSLGTVRYGSTGLGVVYRGSDGFEYLSAMFDRGEELDLRTDGWVFIEESIHMIQGPATLGVRKDVGPAVHSLWRRQSIREDGELR